MEDYVFEDVLAGSKVVCGYPQLDAHVSAGGKPCRVRSLFFPGCSLINYGLPLVKAVYDLLSDAERVEGISLLCCGKILSYEPDGKRVRAAYEDQLRDHVAAAGVERIVTACPNCVAALRSALSSDERTADVEIVALPEELAVLGYRVDADIATRMLVDELATGTTDAASDAKPLFSVHDSCPDRKTGEFADGLRALMPPSLFVDPEHNRKRSQCCGSLVRAAGRYELADAQAQQRGQEAVAAGASAIVTACVSCAYLISVSQRQVPVFQYLELLFEWRIDWRHADGSMKLRFLFDETLGAEEVPDSARWFMGLASDEPAADASVGDRSVGQAKDGAR